MDVREGKIDVREGDLGVRESTSDVQYGIPVVAEAGPDSGKWKNYLREPRPDLREPNTDVPEGDPAFQK